MLLAPHCHVNLSCFSSFSNETRSPHLQGRSVGFRRPHPSSTFQSPNKSWLPPNRSRGPVALSNRVREQSSLWSLVVILPSKDQSQTNWAWTDLLCLKKKKKNTMTVSNAETAPLVIVSRSWPPLIFIIFYRYPHVQKTFSSFSSECSEPEWPGQTDGMSCG